MKTPLVFIFCCLFFDLAEAQTRFDLKNPSFEADAPAPGIVPKGWMNRGDEKSSPPDIQPGFFQVHIPAQAGERYLGLVTRSDNTWEGVGQRLEGYLRRGSTYEFSLWLNRSSAYLSASIDDPSERNWNNATVLRIWGYNSETKSNELLAESAPVGFSKWVEHRFVLNPTVDDFDEIDLIAYYASGSVGKEGNLLIDNCGPIELEAYVKGSVQSRDISPMPLTSEDIIPIVNPSFERQGRYESYFGWYLFRDQIGEKLIVEPGKVIGSNDRKADDGKQFLVLLYQGEYVQAIAQTLERSLKRDKTYRFSMSLARQKKFTFKGDDKIDVTVMGVLKKYKVKQSFHDQSLKLEVWGLNQTTHVYEILDETPAIDHKEWKQYSFVLTPVKSDYDVIVLYPVLVNLKGKKYSSGHILLDNCSNISKY